MWAQVEIHRPSAGERNEAGLRPDVFPGLVKISGPSPRRRNAPVKPRGRSPVHEHDGRSPEPSLPTHPQLAHFPLTHSFTAQYPPHCHHPHRWVLPAGPAPPSPYAPTAARENHRKRAPRPRDATVESGRHEHGARTHSPSARDGSRRATRGGGGVRALVPGDPRRRLRARGLRARALLALQEGLLLPRLRRRRLRPLLPALHLRLPAAALPPVHRARAHELLNFSLRHK